MKRLLSAFLLAFLVLTLGVGHAVAVLDEICRPCGESGNMVLYVVSDQAKIHELVTSAHQSEVYSHLVNFLRQNSCRIDASASVVVSVPDKNATVLMTSAQTDNATGYLYYVKGASGLEFSAYYEFMDDRLITVFSDSRGIQSKEVSASDVAELYSGEPGILISDCMTSCAAMDYGFCYVSCLSWGPYQAWCGLLCAMGTTARCECICGLGPCPPEEPPMDCGAPGLPDCD